MKGAMFPFQDEEAEALQGCPQAQGIFLNIPVYRAAFGDKEGSIEKHVGHGYSLMAHLFSLSLALLFYFASPIFFPSC